MAGIIANSVSVTIDAGSTSANNAVAGYVTDEQISLQVTPPAATSTSWVLSKPTSSTARAQLTDASSLTPKFTPDVAGEYVISVLVDGTTSYTLRASVTQTATTTALEAVRFAPILASGVTAPNLGVAVFHDLTTGVMLEKHVGGYLAAHGSVGTVGANLTDADATIQIGEGVRRTLPISTLSVNRVLTLGVTGAASGDVLEILRLDAEAFTFTIANGGGGGGNVYVGATSTRFLLRAKFDGVNWALHELIRL